MLIVILIGIVVLKHGRSGRPKHKTLYCDDNLQVLYWKDGDTTGATPEHTPHHDVDRSKATRRSSFNVFSRLETRKEVVLRDVLEVCRMMLWSVTAALWSVMTGVCYVMLSYRCVFVGARRSNHWCHETLHCEEISSRTPTVTVTVTGCPVVSWPQRTSHFFVAQRPHVGLWSGWGEMCDDSSVLYNTVKRLWLC